MISREQAEFGQVDFKMDLSMLLLTLSSFYLEGSRLSKCEYRFIHIKSKALQISMIF